MALDVPETGRDDQAAGIDATAGSRTLQQAARCDASDAIAANGDVAVQPACAPAVHDAPVLDDDVLSACCSRLGGSRSTAARGGKQCQHCDDALHRICSKVRFWIG